VVAIDHDGEGGTGLDSNPDPHTPLPAATELVLIATDEAEAAFSEHYPHARRRSMSIRAAGTATSQPAER
jgi:hypothetical protein